MKLRHRYLNPIGVFLIVYMFGLLLFGFSCEAVEWIYTYLNHLFPRIFPVYSIILEKEEYYKLLRIQTLIGLFLSLFLIHFISLKLENKKYERLTGLTDGKYPLKEGIRLYFDEFLLTDAITAALVPAIIVIPSYFISDKLMGYFGLAIPNWLGYSLRAHCGVGAIIPAVLIAALFSFAGRILAIPLTVKSWRAAWLSDI